MSPEDFVRILEGIVEANNDARRSAEQSYQQFVQQQPDLCLRYLLEVTRSPAIGKYIKELALVLFRRETIVQEESCLDKVNHETKPQLLSILESLLMETTDESLRMKIAEIAGEIAGGILDPSEWPRIQQLTGDLCNNSSRAEDKLIGLCLLGYIADSSINLNPHFLPNATSTLQNAFQFFLGNGHGSVVTVTAVFYLVQSLQQPSQLDAASKMVPVLFHSFGQLIQSALEKGATEKSKAPWKYVINFLEYVIDIAENSIGFLQSHFELFVPPLFQFIQQETRLPNSIKFQMIELLVTLAIKNPKKIKKMTGPKNKKQYFLSEMLKISEHYMESVSENPSWEHLDTVEELEGNSLSFFDVGESAFRRVIHALGVAHTYKKLSTLLTKKFSEAQNLLIANQQPEKAWKILYAGLMMVAGYVETTTNMEDPNLLALHRHEVLTMLIQFIQFPPHPLLPSVVIARLRFAAFNAMSSYLLYHGSSLTEENVHRMFPLIISQLSVSVNPAPRVRRSVLIALIHLMENVTNLSLLAQYAAMVLTAICQAIQEGGSSAAFHASTTTGASTIVQESAIAALTSFLELTRSSQKTSSSSSSDTGGLISQTVWLDIYRNISPLLKELLAHYQRRNLEMLWGQTLECITLMGEVVGKEVFYQDAQDLLVFLQQMQATVTPHSDVDIAMLKATVRIARCLGEEFLPHLHSTVTRIFEALSVNAIASEQDLTGHNRNAQHDGDDDEDDIDDDEDDEQDEDDGLQMMETLEGQWVTVRTALIEEQSQALQMLSLLLHNPFLPDAQLQDNHAITQEMLLPPQLATHKARIAAFYPYVQQTAQFLQQALLKSPHEDIRAETLSLLPKVIAVCDAADQAQAKQELLFFCLGLLLPYLEKETNVELLMTGLVTLRTLLLSCGQTNGNNNMSAAVNNIWLSEVQMQAVVTAVKMIMRDSLQRRAMLRAELQMNSREDDHHPHGKRTAHSNVFRTAPANDDDSDADHDVQALDDEHVHEEYQALFQETIELHFHLAQVVNALFVTHQMAFLPIYAASNNGLHDMVVSLSHGYCFVEDRRLAFLVLCDVLEFGLQMPAQLTTGAQQILMTSVTTGGLDVRSLVTQVLQILCECCQETAQYLSQSPAQDTGYVLRRLSKAAVTKDNHSKTGDGNEELVGLDMEVVRCAAYGLGVVQRSLLYNPNNNNSNAFWAQLVTPVLEMSHSHALQVLTSVIAAFLPHLSSLKAIANTVADVTDGRFTVESVGAALDNTVRALGVLLHVRLTRPNRPSETQEDLVVVMQQCMDLFLRYLQYLPFVYDVEEGEKALSDLLDMLPDPTSATSTATAEHLQWPMFLQDLQRSGEQQQQSSQGELLLQAMVPLVKVLHDVERNDLAGLSPVILDRVAHRLYHFLQGPQRVGDEFMLLPRLLAVLQSQSSTKNAANINDNLYDTRHHSQAHPRVGGDSVVDYSASLVRCLQAVSIYGSISAAWQAQQQ